MLHTPELKKTKSLQYRFSRALLSVSVIIATIMLGAHSLFSQEHLIVSSVQGSAQAPRTDHEQLVIDVYKKANKAVVNVTTKAQSLDFFGSSFQEGSGSGVIIDAEKGYVVTNYHVIAGAQRIAVTLSDSQTYFVDLVGQDPDNDIALLKIQQPLKDLVAIPLGDSTALEVGQRVLVIGNPFGLNRTLTTGIISSLGRTIRAESGRLIEDIIQTDAAINPGNSGGPLLDMAGRIVGLNTAIVSRTGENAGIGFAVPVNQIRSALPQLEEFGKVLRPKLGVIIADTEYGPVFLWVKPDSPASRAGLQGARKQVRQGPFIGHVIDIAQADFILTVNGKSVSTKDEILDILSRVAAGEEVQLRVRDGLQRDSERVVKVIPELS